LAVGDRDYRKYLPQIPDLIDRLTIVMMKEIFIPDAAEEYADERRDIMHDVDLLLRNAPRVEARDIQAIIAITLANRFIWENEGAIRANMDSESDESQLRRLRATHSVNGVRATAKNILAERTGGRKDHKIDCLAADLVEEFGNWSAAVRE
jgi:hypothetical protein